MTPEEIERLKREVVVEAKDTLETWGRGKFWIVVAVFAVVNLFGVPMVADFVLRLKTEKLETDFRGKTEKLETDFREKTEKLESEIAANAEKVESKLREEWRQQVAAIEQRAEGMIDKFVTVAASAEMTSQRNGEVIEQVSALQGNVKDALDQLQKLQTNFTAVQSVYQQAKADAPALLPDDFGQIRIKLVPVSTNNTDELGRVLTALNFSVDVPEAESGRLLNGIERVLYVLDKRWFKDNEIERRDPQNHFSFSIGVWGTTPVSAHVYLRGSGKTLDFEGGTNRTGISYLTAKAP